MIVSKHIKTVNGNSNYSNQDILKEIYAVRCLLQYTHNKMNTILLLLVLFSAIFLSLGHSPLPDPVLDIHGKLVRSGIKYRVLDDSGIGLTLATIKNKSCPLDVVQANQEADLNMALTFTPLDPKKSVIRESTDLNIVFSGSTNICNQSGVWMFDGDDGIVFISGNGVTGKPGDDTVPNWFKIVKYEDGYKFMYYPRVCAICVTLSGHGGVNVAENGRKFLTVTDPPLKIKFVT
ncbi:kunitz trypsin inhibitor 5-like [Bidens hawaiensis]|uniref:kunitz trypsin inhibitor 5-like n=1 Tax=Bidens hawaiensis TaxID=980011 RepID=UPI00404AF03D